MSFLISGHKIRMPLGPHGCQSLLLACHIDALLHLAAVLRAMPVGSALLLQDVAADLQKLVDASFAISIFDMFLFLADIRDIPWEVPQSRAVLRSFAVQNHIVGWRRPCLLNHVLLVQATVPLLKYCAQAQLCKCLPRAVGRLDLMRLMYMCIGAAIACLGLLVSVLLSSLLRRLGS